ncbi:transposon Ty3-G Gag-Pol polyprotein [Trichonephila clavipes]|nr:transposon Ty3-G Gag-Pol polyprotein [Trichonephila clavipes]
MAPYSLDFNPMDYSVQSRACTKPQKILTSKQSLVREWKRLKWYKSPRGLRPTVPNSVYLTLDPEVHEQMFRSGDESDVKPLVLSSHQGLPRANGQVERINRTIIPVLSKMSEDDPTKWFKHVPSLQEVLNSTFQRSINTTPFELLFGTQINNKTDLRIQQLIDEQLQLEFNENRELLRKAAKTQILKVQNENKKSYNLRRKSPYLYSVKDLVAIKNAKRTWTKTLQ